MNAITLKNELPKLIVNKNTKKALSNMMHFGLMFGTTVSFIAITALTWIEIN